MARSRNDGFLPLDEIGEAGARALGTTVYTIANGQPKARMSETGGEREQERWSVAVLSTGELALDAYLATAGKKSMDGMHVRLVDLRADNRKFGAFDDLHGAASSADFARDLQMACKKDHGHAGREMVAKLIQIGPERAMNYFEAYKKKMVQASPIKLGGQTQRIAARFAAAATAGEVASKLGITNCPQDSAYAACALLFTEWRDLHPNQDTPKVERYLALLRDLLDDPASAGLVEAGSNDRAEIGWWDQHYVYLKPPEFRAIMGKQAADAANVLNNGGHLMTSSGEQVYKLPQSICTTRPRVYALRRNAGSSSSAT